MKSLTWIRALLLGLALSAGMLVSPAAAQINPEVTYDLDFSTDLNLLLNPNDMMAQKFAMWKTPTQLASLRSAPMIRLTNRTDSDLSITQIRLDLGDPTAQFDSIAFLEQPDNGAPTVLSHTDLTYLGDMKSFLTIDFPAGLAPGDSFTFQVRLHNLAGPGLVNYENTLWDKNDALFAANRADNALVTVTAGNLSSQSPVTLNFPAARLFEYPLANANFPQDNLGASGSSTVLTGGHEDTIVGIVRFTQTTGVIIPEPGTWSLAAIGLVVVGWHRRRKNKAA
jgi:hypothetical protein